MGFIHTADRHLGRIFHGHRTPLLEAREYIGTFDELDARASGRTSSGR
jgi:hypothetical protein